MDEVTNALPESEQNPPDDTSIGYKIWSVTHDRFWTGRQWTDTYREIVKAQPADEERDPRWL